MFLRILIGLALALLLIYGLVKAYPLLSGPAIHLDSPAAYATLPDGFVTVSGTALRTATLTLNSGVLLIDENGRFSPSLTLPSGDAILSLTARDRFGRAVSESRVVHIP